MFGKFEKYRAHYESGQIFPFLIAILCVVLIMIMITVNLGQIGLLKTEISNAADAAALAGASALSASLLGFGLRSEAMCAFAAGCLVGLLVCMWLFVPGWIACILLYVAFMIKMQVDLMQAFGEARLAWTNAKKSSLQFGFSNVAVEEHRPTFEEFLKTRYGLDREAILDLAANNPNLLKQYYNYYYQGYNPTEDLRPFTRTGFGRFMEDHEKGYWHFGQIKPGKSSSVVLRSGYGWSRDGRNNSYDDCQNPHGSTLPGYVQQGANCIGANNAGPDFAYKLYDNWVGVEVFGSTIYGIDFFSWLEQIINCIIQTFAAVILIPWFFDWMDDAVTWVIETFLFFLTKNVRYMFPTGIELRDGSRRDYDDQVNKNYLTVRVTRHKKENNVGLWNFRYDDVSATASSHAFQEHPGSRNGTGAAAADYNYKSETIRPVFLEGLFMWMCLSKWLSAGGFSFSGTNAAHLFETELTNVF